MADQREVTCPNCQGSVLVKKAGKAFASISAFLKKNCNIQIPTSALNYIKEHTPVSKASIFNGPCPVCNGKTKIKDPSDDSAEYQQMVAYASKQSTIDEMTDLENQLGNACGNKYTIVAGSETLQVGLGFNNCSSYRVDTDAGMRNWGITSDISAQGSLAIPKGATANHIQGLNVTTLPGGTGMYNIVCSNKFSVLAGAQGVDISTGGPLTINAGITQIIAPEITLGCKSGRLLLEGDVVNINGKSVEVAPSDGHFFVKGTMSNTGNLITGGHAHAESVSFVNAICTGRNETSRLGAAGDAMTGPTFWGGPAAKALPAAINDLLSSILQNTTNPAFLSQILSVRFVTGLTDKMSNMAYAMQPTELLPCGYAYVAGVPTFPVYLYPHVHILPDMKHAHDTRIPNIDCSASNSKEVRAKVKGGLDSSAPKYVSNTSALTVVEDIFKGIGNTAVAAFKALEIKFTDYFT